MKIGLILPTIGIGAGRSSLEAGARIADTLGWSSVWATDHLMVPSGPEADEYGTILEALVSLTHVAALHQRLTIGTSVIVPPMRNSVLLAKELATIDTLTDGRLIVGVGVADRSDLPEFRNLGVEARMNRRGALVDETIALWRHLWSGGPAPFHGEFHTLDDYVFKPLPPQRDGIPIWTGGRSDRALSRAATLADGYHAARTGPDDLAARIPTLRQLSSEVGRPLPTLSARVRVEFGESGHDVYTMSGTEDDMRRELERFQEVGLDVLTVVLGETSPDEIEAAAERFHVGVVQPVLG